MVSRVPFLKNPEKEKALLCYILFPRVTKPDKGKNKGKEIL